MVGQQQDQLRVGGLALRIAQIAMHLEQRLVDVVRLREIRFGDEPRVLRLRLGRGRAPLHVDHAERAAQRGQQRVVVDLAPACADMLVRAQQIAGAGLAVVAAHGQAFDVFEHDRAARQRGRGLRRWRRWHHANHFHRHRRGAQLFERRARRGRQALRIGEHQRGKAVAQMRQQPALALPLVADHAHRCIGADRAGHHRAGERRAVRRVQRRRRQHGRRRQPAAVDQLARERMLTGEPQHAVAKHAAGGALRRDEIGRARRMQDVLVGRVFALAGIGVEQRVGRPPFQHQAQLPRQVLGVLHAAVGAARAERRHPMRGVPGEQHTAMAKTLHPLAREGVDADPFELEPRVGPEQRAQPRQHAFGLTLLFGIGIPAQLEIDAPDIVRLPMQQHRLVAVERRIEPEPALGREAGGHLHIGDQEAVAEGPALALQPHQLAHGTARAVRHHHVACRQRVVAIRRRHGQHDMIFLLAQPADAMTPAQFESFQFGGPIDEIALDVVLLQVDEGRTMVTALRQQIEAVDLLLVEEHAADVPAHTLVDQPLAAAEAIENIERALGEADRTRTAGQRAVVIEQYHRHLLLRQVDRRGEADRTGPDHDHRPYRGPRVRLLLGAAPVGEGAGLVVVACLSRGFLSCGFHVVSLRPSRPLSRGLRRPACRAFSPAALPTFPCRARRSRCADA